MRDYKNISKGPFEVVRQVVECTVGGLYLLTKQDCAPFAYVPNSDDAELYAKGYLLPMMAEALRDSLSLLDLAADFEMLTAEQADEIIAARKVLQEFEKD